MSPEGVQLSIGEYNLDSREKEAVFRKVHFIVIHPDFDDVTFEYDLALLWFYESVKFAPNIIPICIPENDYDFHGDTAWVTGWGQIYEGKAKYPLKYGFCKKSLRKNATLNS